MLKKRKNTIKIPKMNPLASLNMCPLHIHVDMNNVVKKRTVYTNNIHSLRSFSQNTNIKYLQFNGKSIHIHPIYAPLMCIIFAIYESNSRSVSDTFSVCALLLVIWLEYDVYSFFLCMCVCPDFTTHGEFYGSYSYASGICVRCVSIYIYPYL